MTDTAGLTCAPPAGTATDTWHWLRDKGGKQAPYRWQDHMHVPRWWAGLYDAKMAHAMGYTYVGPVAPYVAAPAPQKPSLDRARVLAAQIEAILHDLPDQGVALGIARKLAAALFLDGNVRAALEWVALWHDKRAAFWRGLGEAGTDYTISAATRHEADAQSIRAFAGTAA